jgi:hypothetical protein
LTVALLLTNRGSTRERQATGPTGTPGTSAPSTPTATTPSPSPTPRSSTPTATSSAPPPGAALVTFTSPGNDFGTYSVTRPAGWSVSRGSKEYGSHVIFTAPNGRTSLLIDHARTPAPDALADLEAVAASRSRSLGGYREITLQRTSTARLAAPALADVAVWEYQWTERGVRMHGRFVDLIVSRDGGAYALWWRGPEAVWKAGGKETMQTVQSTFRPAFG